MLDKIADAEMKRKLKEEEERKAEEEDRLAQERYEVISLVWSGLVVWKEPASLCVCVCLLSSLLFVRKAVTWKTAYTQQNKSLAVAWGNHYTPTSF